MRRSTLLLMVACSLSCGAPPEAPYVVIDGFLDGAVAASCEPVALDGPVAISEIRTATDSTWLLLDAPQRRILELDHRLRPLWSLEYPSAGPGSLVMPHSVAVLGDSALVVADRGAMKLVVLSRTGEELRSAPLDFVPHSLAATPSGEVLLTPLPVGGRGTLLIRYDGVRLRDVAVPPRFHADLTVRALGNVAVVGSLPDGGALVLHQYLGPRGFHVSPSGTVRPLAVPTPDATLDQLRFTPTAPLTEDQAGRILAPALALSVDAGRSEVYLLTRSGRVVDGVPQRAILRADARLRFIEAFTVDVAASGLAVLPARSLAVVADEEDRLFACRLPRGGVAHAEAD